MSNNIVSRIAMLGCVIALSTACSRDGSDADSLYDRDVGLVGDQAGGRVDLNDNSTGGSGGSKNTGGTGGATAPRTGVIAAGTTLALSSGSRVCTDTHKVGDSFTATLRESAVGSNGVSIPAGTPVTVQITSLVRGKNSSDPVQMGFLVQSIRVNGRDYPVDSRITDIETVSERSSGNKDVQKVIGGAVAGAIIGQILGKDTKSTVIGAATGAAAGTAVAMATADYEGCVPSGGRITIALNSPVTINVAN